LLVCWVSRVKVPSCCKRLRKACVTYSLRRGSSRTLFLKILTWTEREPAGRPLVGPTRYPAQPVVDRIPQRKQKLTQRRKAAKTQGRSEHRLLNIEHPTCFVETFFCLGCLIRRWINAVRQEAVNR